MAYVDTGLFSENVLWYEQWQENYRHNSDSTEMTLLYEVLNALVRSIEQYNYVSKEHLPKVRGPQLIILNNNLTSIHVAWQLYLKGFFAESLMIARSLFESLMRILFCEMHPEDWQAVIHDSRVKGERKFNVTNFYRDDLGVDADYLYKYLCSFSHSVNRHTLSDCVKIAREGQKRPISPSIGASESDIVFDQRIILSCVYLFAVLFSNYFEVPELERAKMPDLSNLALATNRLWRIVQEWRGEIPETLVKLRDQIFAIKLQKNTGAHNV